jgi:hypothetical protein
VGLHNNKFGDLYVRSVYSFMSKYFVVWVRVDLLKQVLFLLLGKLHEVTSIEHSFKLRERAVSLLMKLAQLNYKRWNEQYRTLWALSQVLRFIKLGYTVGTSCSGLGKRMDPCLHNHACLLSVACSTSLHEHRFSYWSVDFPFPFRCSREQEQHCGKPSRICCGLLVWYSRFILQRFRDHWQTWNLRSVTNVRRLLIICYAVPHNNHYTLLLENTSLYFICILSFSCFS